MSSARLWSLVALAILPAARLTPPKLRSSESRGSTSDDSHGTSGPYDWRNAVITGGGFVSSIIFRK